MNLSVYWDSLQNKWKLDASADHQWLLHIYADLPVRCWGKLSWSYWLKSVIIKQFHGWEGSCLMHCFSVSKSSLLNFSFEGDRPAADCPALIHQHKPRGAESQVDMLDKSPSCNLLSFSGHFRVLHHTFACACKKKTRIKVTSVFIGNTTERRRAEERNVCFIDGGSEPSVFVDNTEYKNHMNLNYGVINIIQVWN